MTVSRHQLEHISLNAGERDATLEAINALTKALRKHHSF
jgi:hypothetical protein